MWVDCEDEKTVADLLFKMLKAQTCLSACKRTCLVMCSCEIAVKSLILTVTMT